MLQRIGPWRLTGMATPLVLWAVHFVAVYSMQGLACAEDWQRQRVAGLEMVTWWLLLATLLVFVAIAAMGTWALRCRRFAAREVRAAEVAGNPVAAAPRRRRFMAMLTALVALVSFIAVAYTTIPVLLLAPCA